MTNSLPTRPLGTSGPEITTVGFGAWAAGGGGWAFAWGPQDDADSIAAIRHAVAKGVIVYSPMQSGLLTDSFNAERVSALAPDDWRRKSPQHQPPKLQQNLALRDGLKPIAAKHGTSTAAIAVAWTLAWPGVTGAIVGARSPEQVDGWLPASSLRLDGADLVAIDAAIAKTAAGFGPTAPA